MTVANPDLPDRALPAAWRLLVAAELDADPDRPCEIAPYSGECAFHGGSWDGPGADELRHAAGVLCLSQIVGRVVAAEQEAERQRDVQTITDGMPVLTDFDRLAAVLESLWRAVDADVSGTLTYAIEAAVADPGALTAKAHAARGRVLDLLAQYRGVFR